MSLRPRLALAPFASLALGACAGSYTGPVEVTRFIAENPAGLGQGDITLVFPEEVSNERARSAFADAVAGELGRLGYSLVMSEGEGTQVASIRTSRNGIAGAGRSGRSPVTVGGGASTGTFGSGIGLGVGINLGGGQSGPAIVTDLAVRITSAGGETLWEGRAELPTSVNSPYSEVEASAGALAAALFADFPGGNGETVTIDVDELPR